MTFRRVAVLAVVLTTLASCTSPQEVAEGESAGTTAAEFQPPRWGPPEAAQIPPDVTSLSLTAAGWDGGALLAGNGLDPQLITSKDLTTWRHTMPDGLTDLTYGPIAGYGPAAYVVGSTVDGAAVWRTEDGDTWTRAELPGTLPSDPYLSVAAGPKGVLVAGYDHRSATPTDIGERYAGYRIWHSTDGRAFEPAGEVPVAELYQHMGVRLTATGDGFLLTNHAGSGDVFESADGRHWTDTLPGLPDANIDAVGSSNGTTVVLSTWFNSDTTVEEPGLSAYFHRAGEPQWTEGTIDLGKLPDVGVEPRAQQNVHGVAGWGTGFVAYGGTKGGSGIGAVWTSADGTSWTRLSIKDGGFDEAPIIFAALPAGETTTLLGADISINGPGLTVWRGVAEG